jgi:hypothetical protein
MVAMEDLLDRDTTVALLLSRNALGETMAT